MSSGMNRRRSATLALILVGLLVGLFSYLGLDSLSTPGLSLDLPSEPEPPISEEPPELPLPETEPEEEPAPEPEEEPAPEPVEGYPPAKPKIRTKPIYKGGDSEPEGEDEEIPVFHIPEVPLGTLGTLATVVAAMILVSRKPSIII
jgi:outer membrane biosynthesis protein TonB